MFALSTICSKTTNISLRKYLFAGETTMNIIKFDRTQNKRKFNTSKMVWIKNLQNIYLQIIVTLRYVVAA